MDDVLAAIRELLDSAGFAIYAGAIDDARVPAIPWIAGIASDEIDEDWRDFLHVARMSRTPVVYLTALHYDPKSAEAHRLDTRGVLPEDMDHVEEINQMLEATKVHEGRICEIRLAFFANGAAHTWSRRAVWFAEMMGVVRAVEEGSGEDA